jgi:hypothetical protein
MSEELKQKWLLENNWIWNIPVYSSNTKENWLLIWIDKKHIKENELFYQYCLTWSIDWYAWKLFVRNQNNANNEQKDEFYFTINNHCGILIPRVDNLDLHFVELILQNKFFEKSKWYWNNKLWNNQINDIDISIPLDKNWNFDLDKQKEIAEKYEKIEKLKNNLIQELEELEKIKVEI